MNRKKTIKQLMAIGVQRNDAEVFIRSYRKIQKAGMHKLCEAIMNPPMPVPMVHVNLNPQKLRSDVFIHAAEFERSRCQAGLIERSLDQVKYQLAEQLAKSGAVEVRVDREFAGVRVSGSVMVIMPNEQIKP